MKEIKKYEILKQLLTRQIKGYQAASLLGYSQVHISRLKQRLLKYGFEGLLRPRIPSPRKIPDNLKNQISDLYKNIYYDFNIMHFKEKLEENHNIKLSYETVRKILIESKQHYPKKKKKVYRRRRRMPKAGMLIQMDGSQHKWLKDSEEKQWLIATIDDATNEVLFAKFYSYEGVFTCMEVIRKSIENKGLFYSLYVDKTSHFKTTRYGGLHVNISPEQEETHIERALQELNINLILANSPQAKGRVERLFGTFQNRLIKEMRLRGIKNYQQANNFLEKEYIAYHNKKFAHTQGIDTVYKPLPKNINLDLIFCKKFSRKVNFDNTIKFEGEIIQLHPTEYRLSFAKCVVDVCLLEDNRIYILYQGKLIHTTKLSKRNKVYKVKKQIEDFLSQREYQLCRV
jgi:hypothetical protein